jgi:2-phospho-L-lactate guanylyltransferase
MMQLLEHTFKLLQLLLQSGEIVGFIVISRDTSILQLVQDYNGCALLEKAITAPPLDRLNLALAQAARWCNEKANASALMLLPSDLPLLEIEDLRALLRFLQLYPAQPLGIIAPDRHEKGTNTLLLRPPDLLGFKYHFGEESFAYHLAALGNERGTEIFICQRPGLAFDLDLPEDLAALPEAIRNALLKINSDV